MEHSNLTGSCMIAIYLWFNSMKSMNITLLANRMFCL